MKSRSFVLQACAVGVVTAALLLTACGGLGSGYSYPYYPPPYQPSHSSGSASDSSGSSSSTPESSSSESSSEEPSSPASSEPPAPSEPELTPKQRLALYRNCSTPGAPFHFPHRLPPCPTPRKPVQRSCSRRAGSPTNAPMAKITLLSCPGAIFPALFPRNYTHPARPPLPSSFHT